MTPDPAVEDATPIPWRHPAFIRAEQFSEPLRSHFPKSSEEAAVWTPWYRTRALTARVLVVAVTRITGEWAAYCDAVPGKRHEDEWQAVSDYGTKLDEAVARTLFPLFDEVPYAD